MPVRGVNVITGTGHMTSNLFSYETKDTYSWERVG